MANGFVQRWKGKIDAAQLWLAGTQLTPSGGDLNLSYGASNGDAAVSGTNIPSYGYHTLPGATAAVDFDLDDPVAGRRVVLATVEASSAARTVTASTVNGVTFDGTNNRLTFSNSVNQAVELLGLSTLQWAIMGASPVMTLNQTSASTGGPTLSTV